MVRALVQGQRRLPVADRTRNDLGYLELKGTVAFLNAGQAAQAVVFVQRDLGVAQQLLRVTKFFIQPFVFCQERVVIGEIGHAVRHRVCHPAKAFLQR